jgi:hypothetical protein
MGYNYMSIFAMHRPFTLFFGRSILNVICGLVVWVYFMFDTLRHDKVNAFIFLELIINCHIGDDRRTLFFIAHGMFEFGQNL